MSKPFMVGRRSGMSHSLAAQLVNHLNKKLTVPQIEGLRYYRALADKVRVKVGNVSRNPFKHPDPRVEAALIEKKLIAHVGFHYGPLYAITDDGRAMLAILDKGE